MSFRIPWWLWAAFAATIVVEVAFAKPGDGHLPWWHESPGFFAVYGLAGCWLIVIVSKLLGKIALQVPEGDQ